MQLGKRRCGVSTSFSRSLSSFLGFFFGGSLDSHGHRQSQNHAAGLAAVFHFLSHPFLLQSGRSSFSQEGLHHHLVLRASSQASSSSSHSWAHAPDGSSASRRDRSLCIRTCTSPNIGQVLRFLLLGRLHPKTENSQEQVCNGPAAQFLPPTLQTSTCSSSPHSHEPASWPLASSLASTPC